MIISRIRPAESNPSDQNSRTTDQPPATKTASMALVPAAQAVATSRTAHSHYRPDPAFMAHLIAIAQQSPQTRNLRRASPDEAHGLYRATRSTSITSHGILLSLVA